MLIDKFWFSFMLFFLFVLNFCGVFLIFSITRSSDLNCEDIVKRQETFLYVLIYFPFVILFLDLLGEQIIKVLKAQGFFCSNDTN